MNYYVINNSEMLFNFKKEWQTLYQNGNFNIFNSYEWNSSWFLRSNQSIDLFIIVFYKQKKNEPCAIFPLYIDNKKILRFIADKHTDYSNFLITDMEIFNMYDIFKTFNKLISEESTIDSLELKNINAENIYLGFLNFQFDNRQIVYQSNAFSYTSLKGNENLFQCFSHLKSSHRSELKRIYKKNEKFKSHIYDRIETPLPIDKIKTLMKSMVDNSSRGEGFLNESLLKTIDTLYNSGHLLINEISDEDNSIAINFMLYKDNKYIFWIDIYENIQFINIFSYLKFIEYICINNKDMDNIFDFGRGLYDYKIKNFFPVIKTQVTFFYSKKNSNYLFYLFKFFLKLSLMNFYKKNKTLISKLRGN